MLICIVSQYLGSHKRLVVPQLGTFIVKEPGVSVVFSELLKRDDGVLRQLLQSEGTGEVEAAGEIDRFVFEVRHAVEHGDEFPLEGLGVMKPGPNGTIVFVYEPQPVVVTGLQSAAASTSPMPGSAPAPAPETPLPVKEKPGDEPRVSPSAKMNPDPSIRGLRYGKPPKNTNAYTFVDRAPRRRGVDRFVWIALIAAVIAVAAIAFGSLRTKDAEAVEYVEQPQTPQTPAADAEQQPITE